MTIKSKLIANVLFTAVIIVAISLPGIVSMRFIQEKLADLTEKSTPFQMRTVEFQRELQSCITALVKVNAAHTMAEYRAFRDEAEAGLDNVRKAGELLEKLNAGRSSHESDELTLLSGALFAAAEARIKSDVAASEANARVSRQMKEASDRLKELDAHIRTLQVTHSAAFARALENTGRFSTRLRDLEELRNLVKELLSVSGSAHTHRSAAEFLIAKGKIKTLLGRASRKTYREIGAANISGLSEDLNEFLQLQATANTQKDDESKKWALESLKEAAENMNRFILTLNQEIELASSKLAIETQREGLIFAQANSANSILLTNSELAGLGLSVTGGINLLFTLDSAEQLDKIHADIRSVFTDIHERAVSAESSLAGLGATNELKVLHAAHNSLEAIRNEFYTSDGIVAKLHKKFDAIEQANRSADKLNAMVIRQLAQGKEGVSRARGEQENSIITVNTVILRSISLLLGIGIVAVVIGNLFGFWIYRSVMLPLRVIRDAVRRQQELGIEKASLAEAVAGGDLSREVQVSRAITLDPGQINDDEMGMVLNAVVGMSQAQVTLDGAFAGMTASLRSSRDEAARRDHLKNGLHELNTILRDEHKITDLGDETLAFMAAFLGAGVGILYLYDENDGRLHTLSTYAVSRSGRLNEGFRLGEGLPGQAASERKMICLNAVPHGYLPITSALGEADPLNIVIMPVLYNDTLIGVLELGSFRRFGEDDFEFLHQSLEEIAIAIKVNRSHQLVSDLLKRTQAQTEELRVQQEELQQTNESRRNGDGCRRKQHDQR